MWTVDFSGPSHSATYTPALFGSERAQAEGRMVALTKRVAGTFNTRLMLIAPMLNEVSRPFGKLSPPQPLHHTYNFIPPPPPTPSSPPQPSHTPPTSPHTPPPTLSPAPLPSNRPKAHALPHPPSS